VARSTRHPEALGRRSSCRKSALSPRHPEVLADEVGEPRRMNGPDVAPAGPSTLRGPRYARPPQGDGVRAARVFHRPVKTVYICHIIHVNTIYACKRARYPAP